MEIEFRLKRILDEAKLDTRGRIERIVRGTGLTRPTVRAIYHNKARGVSLKTLERLCEWLDRKELCRDLPGALFAARPSKLLRAMTDPGRVTLYLGEYRSAGYPNFRVARDDAAAASMIVQKLSRYCHDRPLRFKHVHVHAHVPEGETEVKAKDLKSDRAEARAIFEEMVEDRATETAVLIGSSRANYLVEIFLGDLFGCRAFKDAPGDLPLYLRYHQKPRFSSCIGGDNPPTVHGSDGEPGIYYSREGQWMHMPSETGRRGTGVVIARRDPGLSHLTLAVFGVSAIATAAAAKFVCDTPDAFWPSQRIGPGTEVGIYLCKFTLGGMATGEEGIDEAEVGVPDIVELDFEPARSR
jgi:DNA-binding Xre family transcriptional regulator